MLDGIPAGEARFHGDSGLARPLLRHPCKEVLAMIAGVVTTKRALDFVVKAVAAAAFVVCVEWLLRRRQRKNRSERVAASPRARLRVRHGTDRGRVTFAIEGTLDEFVARLLACSVAQVPPSATMILDLSAAGPIRGRALAVFARVFAAGRQVRLRGLGEGHHGLLVLCTELRQTDRDQQPSRAAGNRSSAVRHLGPSRTPLFDRSKKCELETAVAAAA